MEGDGTHPTGRATIGITQTGSWRGSGFCLATSYRH